MQNKQTEQYEPKASSMEFAPCHSSVCPQCGGNIKENDLFDRISGLLMTSGFETSLMQSMLSEMYCRDKKATARYEDIRTAAIIKAKKQFGEIHAAKNLELQESIRKLSNELERLSGEVQVLTQEKKTLQEKNQNIGIKLSATERNYNDAAVALKSYMELSQWYERLVREVPVIRKKNSGILREQTWDSALECYIEYNPKPKVNKFED